MEKNYVAAPMMSISGFSNSQIIFCRLTGSCLNETLTLCFDNRLLLMLLGNQNFFEESFRHEEKNPNIKHIFSEIQERRFIQCGAITFNYSFFSDIYFATLSVYHARKGMYIIFGMVLALGVHKFNFKAEMPKILEMLRKMKSKFKYEQSQATV